MELTAREQFVLKLFSMLDNHELMKKEGKETPTIKELLEFMNQLRITQYPRVSFDTMIKIIADFEKIGDQQVETSKFITQQMKKSQRHGTARL